MKTKTQNITNTYVGICGLQGLPIGVMVFILSPYPNPAINSIHHSKLSAFLDFKKKLKGSVHINHIHVVLPIAIIYICVLINHINQCTKTQTIVAQDHGCVKYMPLCEAGCVCVRLCLWRVGRALGLYAGDIPDCYTLVGLV